MLKPARNFNVLIFPLLLLALILSLGAFFLLNLRSMPSQVIHEHISSAPNGGNATASPSVATGMSIDVNGHNASPSPNPNPAPPLVSGSGGQTPTINTHGKLILVNRAINVQALYAYQNGRQVFTTLVTTGQLYLQTYLGTWHVYAKLTNVSMISAWPKGSPYYYPPEHASYALDYDGALYIHDATWRSVFGPGTDRWHYDPKFGWMDGSHGCVNVPLAAMAWLYQWADIGTTVEVID